MDDTITVEHLAGIPFESIAGFLQKKMSTVKRVRYLAQEIEVSASFTTLVLVRLTGTTVQLSSSPKWRWHLLTALIPWAIVKGLIEGGGVHLGFVGTVIVLGVLFALSFGLWSVLGLGSRGMRLVRTSLREALADRTPIEAEDRALREAVARRHEQMGISKRPQ